MKSSVLAVSLVLGLVLSGCGASHPQLASMQRTSGLQARSKSPADVVRAVAVSSAQLMAYADTNKDSRLSPEEALAASLDERSFGMLDADKDGFLTVAEMTSEAAHAGFWTPMFGMLGQMFGMLDANKDKALSRAELDTPRLKLKPMPWQTNPDPKILDAGFTASDRDANGSLDADERVVFLAFMVEKGYKLSLSMNASR